VAKYDRKSGPDEKRVVRYFKLRKKNRLRDFWLKRGRKLFGEPFKTFFHNMLRIYMCNFCFGKRHNVEMRLSAHLLALYLSTKIRQGFGIRSIIKTWRRSIRHYFGCIG